MIESEDDARAWVRALPECDAAAWDRLERLIVLLAEENTRQNLVAKATLPHVWQRHIADSAQLLAYVPRETGTRWVDLGTGAGFPGIVVACLKPDVEVTLVESRTRRIAWLESLCDELQLKRTKVVGARLESIDTFAADVISARAFAQLSSLLEISARFSTNATLWLLPKGRSAAQELAELRGWSHAFHVEPSLTDTDAGIVVGTLAGRKGAKP